MIVFVVWSSSELLEVVPLEAERLAEADEHDVAGDKGTVEDPPQDAEEVAQAKLKSATSRARASGE